MGRSPCCAKAGLKKGRWTVEEDQLLINYVQEHGEGSWRAVPKNAGLKRCGKSCRLRWINYLRTDLKRGNITPEEEDVIIKLHASLGNRWSMIAGNLPGRTDNEIKNYWNSHLSRKVDRFIKLQNAAPSTFINSKSMTLENQTSHSTAHRNPLVDEHTSVEGETAMLPIAITGKDGTRHNICESKLQGNSSMEVQVSDLCHAMVHRNADQSEIMKPNVEDTRVDELKAGMEEPFGSLDAEQVRQSNLLDRKIRDFSDILNLEIQRGNGITVPTQVTATNKGTNCSEWSCRNAESEDWVDLAWKSILQSHKLWDEEISWLWDSDTIDKYQL